MASIFLSAGHSSKDPGTSQPIGTEAELMTNFRNLVADNLRARGLAVTLDNYGSWNDPLPEAIKQVKKHDLAVEFHANFSGNAASEGVEAYSLEGKRKFASSVAEAAARAMGSPLRGDRGWRQPSESQHTRLGYVDAGGVLVELFFISNQGDTERFLKNSGPVAKAVADVVASAVV